MAIYHLDHELLNGSELVQWVRTHAEKQSSTASDNVVLFFTATWCHYCTQMTPIVDEVSKHTQITVITIDINRFPAVSAARGVRSVPAFQLLDRDGETRDTRIGACPKKQLLRFFTAP